MKKYKNLIIGGIVVTIVILTVFIKSNGWTYVKYNNELYITNTSGMQDVSDIISEKVGQVEIKVSSFLKPIINNSSNGFTKGSEIYKSKIENTILIKYNGKFFQGVNVKETENWGNGIKLNF